MGVSVVHLPDGQSFTVQPVFSGFFFKSDEVNRNRHGHFPAGWAIVIHTEDDAPGGGNGDREGNGPGDDDVDDGVATTHAHRFTQPTLQNDSIFISSISNPSDSEYRMHSSQSRQIALMLWTSLYWYFQQAEPSPYLETEQSKYTPTEARPQGEWRIRIRRDGIFKSRNMIPKLERMGLIATLDSAVGTSTVENADGWDQMFVSRRAFWQIPSGLFLFTPQPKGGSSHPGSPVSSQPGSPTFASRQGGSHQHTASGGASSLSDVPGYTIPTALSSPLGVAMGPYSSASHLPTYYPPPPIQYMVTRGIRHPLRPKAPRMGEIFYTRYVPSVGKYLSFRVASASDKPVPSLGPVSTTESEHSHLTTLSDTGLLRLWLSNRRVSKFWGEFHPSFVTDALASKHSFPAIGLWDGLPFGYFEIYWVREDGLGQLMGRDADDWDRGLHVLVGEEWARGKVGCWLSSLVQWCWHADNRTMNVCLEPRVDNHKHVKPRP